MGSAIPEIGSPWKSQMGDRLAQVNHPVPHSVETLVGDAESESGYPFLLGHRLLLPVGAASSRHGGLDRSFPMDFAHNSRRNVG